MRHLLFFLLILLSFSNCKTEQLAPATPAAITVALNTDWEIRQADTDDWMPVANIPSTVHTALLNNKRIEDPFYRNNEATLQWIETKDWEYRKRFDVPEDLLKEEVVELNFKGLDTYADVYLNGQKILEANNMFRSWLVDVKALLKISNNELRIVFHSPIAIENEKWKTLGYELPDGSRRTLTRKAAFHYGWDWGPRFVTMGPWQPIEIKAWSKTLINNVKYRTFPKGDVANIQAFFDIDAKVASTAEISVEMDGETYKKQIDLKVGNNKDSLSFIVKKPQLWWPNGLGQQYLYNISGNIQGADFSDTKEDRIGIREVILRQPESNDGLGFMFEINGKRIFSKGANYIPQDIFQDRVTNADYKNLLADAKKANMNMLRVWGGGIYENDAFYQTCDELGLLVWQDFMFANAMVPGDEAFRQNVAAEAKEQVDRLANHPCIALWCGNNEISEGWHRWGWQDGLTEPQKKKIWEDYKIIFNNILPEAVEKNNPTIPYWESSPQFGRGDANHVYVGDAHYWGIWHDAEPFENFKFKVPRFMSEYGFQSLPDKKTIAEFTKTEDRSLDSEVMKAHQKHSRGNALINEYMARDYRTPKDFDQFIYVSQLLQADGIKMGMNAHMSRQPYCSGSLYWQFNDCWPVTSWSSIDYKGRWKALHYTAKKTFEPLHIAIDYDGTLITPMIINHTFDRLPLLVRVRIFDFAGTEKYNFITPATVAGMSGQLTPGATKQQVTTRGGNSDATVLYMELLRPDSSFITESHIFLEKPKKLNLKKPNINPTITKTAEGYRILLETDYLAKSVYLETDQEGWFSDNYFDLLPGRNKELIFMPDQKNGTSSEELIIKIRSLVDSY